MDKTTITGTAEYTSYRVPAEGEPHHVTRSVRLPVEIRQASTLQAPVAARIPGDAYFPVRSLGAMVEIRTHDGCLYQQLLDSGLTPIRPGNEEFRTSFGKHRSALEAREAIRAGLNKIILIDGTLWTQIQEPVIDVRPIVTFINPGPSNRGAWQVFALTEYEAAVAAGEDADAVAAAVGYKPRTPLPPVEVLIPSAFTMATSAERVSRARETAASEVGRAQRILDAGTPEAMSHASQILAKAAHELSRQTGESSFSAGD